MNKDQIQAFDRKEAARFLNVWMTKPYLPYARVSSDEQREAETIKTQIAEVNLYSSAHPDLPLAEWILDEGISGMILFHERPGGARIRTFTDGPIRRTRLPQPQANRARCLRDSLGGQADRAGVET